MWVKREVQTGTVIYIHHSVGIRDSETGIVRSLPIVNVLGYTTDN